MSKKNIKNNKKNSTRKNYKIEPLEPRLMMSADPVIDFSDNNELNTQLTALYDSIESNLDSKVSSYTSDIKTSGLTLNDANGDAFSNVSDFLKDVGDNVKSDISQAFALAKSEAQNALAAINAELEV
ncbi:MAG: LEPR-XLL domain-containing protein [Fibrobacter sp.]|nr:LEPR-XLL domain-containing protein [Fibrobacter sp.]